MNLLMQKVAFAVFMCVHICVSPVFGQRHIPQADPVPYTYLVKKGYGLDQDLINGLQYYNRNRLSMGHPYYQNNQFRKGSISIEGEIFSDVSLKYDIHSQNVEMEYENLSGGNNQVITIFDRVDAFNLGEYQFQKLTIEEGSAKYYQVITTACFTLYMFWEKELLPLNGSTTYVEQFADAKHTLWLDLDGALTRFNSRKDFSQRFPEADKKEIKRLLSRNQFRFRTADVDEIIHNMESVCYLLKGSEKN